MERHVDVDKTTTAQDRIVLTTMSLLPARMKWLLAGGMAIGLLAVWGVWSLRSLQVVDGFESSDLSSVWSKSRFEPGSVRLQRQVVRRGHSAAEITVHPGDIYEEATSTDLASERAEILEQWWLNSRLERTYRYSFSLYLPEDFPIVPTRLIIAQWKQACPPWTECIVASPLLAVRYQGGKLSVTQQIKNEKTERRVLYETHEELRGRWLDFRFDIRFALDESGRIDGWLNDKKIAHYRGQTAFRGSGNFPQYFFRFKTGLYRDHMEGKMTIYVDDYRKDELSRQ